MKGLQRIVFQWMFHRYYSSSPLFSYLSGSKEREAKHKELRYEFINSMSPEARVIMKKLLANEKAMLLLHLGENISGDKQKTYAGRIMQNDMYSAMFDLVDSVNKKVASEN